MKFKFSSHVSGLYAAHAMTVQSAEVEHVQLMGV
jgi:hypothetical protein